MNRAPLPILLALAFLIVGWPTIVAAGDGATVRRLDGDVGAAGADRVSVTAPVGEFRIEGAESSIVSARLELRCQRPADADCRRKASAVELVTTRDGATARVAVRGWPKRDNDGLSLAIRVTMPAELPLDGEFGVGDLLVRGVEAGARLELGVGDVDVEVPAAGIRRVSLEVGVGDASLSVGGRRIEGRGFIGRELDWSGGSGRGIIDVECGVGDIDVLLVD